MTLSTVVNGGEMTGPVFIFESADSTNPGRQKTTSFVGQQKTVVQSPASLLVIDYRQFQLFEYHMSTKRCDTYSLKEKENPEKGISPGDRYRLEMALQLGTAEVETITGITDAEKYRQVLIHWGGQTDLHRTVAPPSVTIYGRRFTAGRDLYLVNDRYEDLETLLEYGKKRESVLALNPLLRRLDISGQVSLLKGVPVQKNNERGVIEKFEKIKKGTVYSYPPVPGACQ